MSELFQIAWAVGVSGYGLAHGIGAALLAWAAVASIRSGGVGRFLRTTGLVALAAAAIALVTFAGEGMPTVLAVGTWVAALVALHALVLAVLVARRVRTHSIAIASAATFLLALPVSFVVLYLSICTFAGCA